MKAVLCRAWGPPEDLKIENLDDPTPGPGQVLIEVQACGVNFPDTLIIQGQYQYKPDFPFSPGGEVSGFVRKVGEGVKHLKPGLKVFALTGWGGFATHVLADAKVVFPLPGAMDFIQGAAFSMTYGTTIYALKNRAQIEEGETLLVLGAAGGVGLAAVEIGTLMGAQVIAAASTDEKLELCREYGARETINYSTENLKEKVKELTDGKGVDVIYDPVGGAFSEPAIRTMAWGGRYLVIGFASGEIPAIPLNLVLLKSCSIVGVFWGEFAQRYFNENMNNFWQLVQWFDQGKLKPHIHATYPLEKASQALREMMDRKVKGKLVLVPES